MTKFDKDFQAWCLSVEQGGINSWRFSKFLSDTRAEAQRRAEPEPNLLETIDAFVKRVTENDKSLFVHLDSADDSSEIEFIFNHRPPEIKNGYSTSPISFFEISQSRKRVSIKNTVIRTLSCNGSESHHISLENCDICLFQVVQSNCEIYLTLRNCRIGTAKLCDNSIHWLGVNNSEIHSIQCPPANGPNPFTGNVSFTKTRFPISEEESALFPGSQHFHNLRHHLEKLENTLEAQKMRALELAADRKYETPVNKAVSWYQYYSTNYGLYSGLPLLAAVAVYFLMVFLVFVFGWAELGIQLQPNMSGQIMPSYYDVGWRATLKNESASCFWLWGMTPQCGNWPRALLLPGQYILNPFGIFSVHSLLVAKSGWVNVILTFSGLFCDILIATGLLAIRKRFKLH